MFIVTYTIFTLFLIAGALSKNATTLLASRLLAGIFGSSPLTNASGTIADIWTPRERGVAASIYATAPFMGPVIGPIVGGWVVQTRLGWRFNFWIMLICASVSLLLGLIITPETYAPVLLRKRARKLHKASDGRIHYMSKLDIGRPTSFLTILPIFLTRPFSFLFTEPIVFLMAMYIAIAYAILYSFFAAYPIVFQEGRGFSPGQGGLAFLGVGAGILIGTSLAPVQNRLYWRAMDRSETGRAPPEARLYLPMIGAMLLPVGLFWFAWTTDRPIHFIVPILAGLPTGMGIAQIMTGLVQYLMDTYTIYCASAIAATVLLRSILAAAFPLISPPLFKNLGNHWSVSVFAFISVACMPLPWLFFKYGHWIRSKSKFARTAGILPPAKSLVIQEDTSSEKDEKDEKEVGVETTQTGVVAEGREES